MSAYPFASSAKVEETLDVLGTRNIATTQQTLLQQILVAIGATGGEPTPIAPDTPTGFAATPGNQFTTLTWDAQSAADTFTINFGLTNVFGASTELTSTATGAEFTHSSGEGIQAGERYYYWIQAVNEVGASSFTVSEVAARSFVTLANGASVNLTTPSGSWTFGTILFAQTPTPTGLGINKSGVIREYDGIGWLNLDTFEYDDAVSISGAFTAINSSGGSYTFWNTEP